MNHRIIELLRNLQARLFADDAAGEDLRRALEALEREGTTVYLVADDGRNDDEADAVVVLSGRRDDELEPVFRIDHDDLTILRELGIDPRRTLRRRR